MADNSLQGGTDSIRDIDRSGAGPKTQVFQVDHAGAGASESLTNRANPFPIGNQSVASGTLSASDAVVAAPVGDGTLVTGASTAGSVVAAVVPNGMIAWTLLIKGYTTGTIYTEASTNSTNGTDGDWVEVKGRRTGTAPGVESVTYAMVANGYYRGNLAGFTYIRARLIGATGATIGWTLSSGMGATFLNSGIPQGSSNIGKITATQFDASADVTMQSAAVAVGNGTVLPATGYGTALIQITGTFVGTVTFEATEDGTNYFAISAVQAGTSTIATTATVPGIYRLVSVGLTNIRARISAYTSGGITALGRTTNAPFAGKVITLSSSSTVALVAGAAAIGTVGVTSLPALVAGTAIVGKFGIDQTTPGTTNLVSIGTNGTVAINAALPTGANVIGALTANQTVNVALIGAVAPLMGNGITGTGSQRVTIASDNTAFSVIATQVVGANSTTGDTGAKTVTGNGATQTNAGNKGVQILVNMGVVTGTTPTFVGKVQGSVDGGTNWYDIPGATTASLTATGVFGILIYPGVAVTAGTTTTGTTAAASMVLPRTWRVVWTIGGTTPSFNISSVQINYLTN